MIRIFIADDHAIVRHGLRQLIDAQLDMRVIGEASDGRQVLLAPNKHEWDILILDLSLPRVNGLEVLRRLRQELPTLRVVTLSMYPEDQYARRVFHEGAVAYLSKDHPSEELLLALRKVAQGGTYKRSALAETLSRDPREGARQAAPHESLSAREYQIFTLILQNRTSTEIAAELNVTASTVGNHVARVKAKLGARTIGEIISYGHRAGLINMP